MKKFNLKPALFNKRRIVNGMITLLIIITGGLSSTASAQSNTPTMITRATFTAAPLSQQRKYVVNMPVSFQVSNLVNYPVGRTIDDAPRPGVTYMTVYDFYYTVLPGVRLDALTDPAHYFIARDSLSIPTLRTIAPGSQETKTGQ